MPSINWLSFLQFLFSQILLVVLQLQRQSFTYAPSTSPPWPQHGQPSQPLRSLCTLSRRCHCCGHIYSGRHSVAYFQDLFHKE